MSYFVKKKSVSIGKLEMQKFILGLEIFDVSEKKRVWISYRSSGNGDIKIYNLALDWTEIGLSMGNLRPKK